MATALARKEALARRRTQRRLLGQLSLRTLARRSHLHVSFVARILRGERNPSLDAARAMATALGITMDEFHRKLAALTGGETKRRPIPAEEIEAR